MNGNENKVVPSSKQIEILAKEYNEIWKNASIETNLFWLISRWESIRNMKSEV